MILTWLHAKIVMGILGLLVVAYLGFTWLAEHDARMKAEATIAANEKLMKAAEAQSATLKDDIAKRDQASAEREKAMIDAIRNLKTTAQIVPYVQSNLAPGAPQPIVVTVPAATAANPTPDAQLTIPQADLPILRDRLNKCDTDANAILTCRADATSNAQRLELAGEQLSTAERERDAYRLELKGGTFWRRTKTALMWVAIGGGAALAGACGSGHCK
jgi:hypothetical protein